MAILLDLFGAFIRVDFVFAAVDDGLVFAQGFLK